MMLLGAPALCTVDTKLWGHAAAPYIMLEFLRQLSHEACYLLVQIFAEADKFANSKLRNKTTFTREKGSIAFNLGLIHWSIESFASGKEHWAQSVNFSLHIYRLGAKTS